VQPDLIVGARGPGSQSIAGSRLLSGTRKGNIGSPEHLRRGWRPGELEGLGDVAAGSRQAGGPVRLTVIIAEA